MRMPTDDEKAEICRYLGSFQVRDEDLEEIGGMRLIKPESILARTIAIEIFPMISRMVEGK